MRHIKEWRWMDPDCPKMYLKTLQQTGSQPSSGFVGRLLPRLGPHHVIHDLYFTRFMSLLQLGVPPSPSLSIHSGTEVSVAPPTCGSWSSPSVCQLGVSHVRLARDICLSQPALLMAHGIIWKAPSAVHKSRSLFVAQLSLIGCRPRPSPSP
jgi:hypothetical protein